MHICTKHISLGSDNVYDLQNAPSFLMYWWRFLTSNTSFPFCLLVQQNGMCYCSSYSLCLFSKSHYSDFFSGIFLYALPPQCTDFQHVCIYWLSNQLLTILKSPVKKNETKQILTLLLQITNGPLKKSSVSPFPTLSLSFTLQSTPQYTTIPFPKKYISQFILNTAGPEQHAG